jgi:hypothetical protein
VTRKRSNIVCPVCNESGGSLKKKWVFKPVHIPKLEKIDNLSKGWNYAAKVLLRLRENFILFPPDITSDETISTGIYEHFSGFTQHSSEEIRNFEFRHLSTPAKSIIKRRDYFEQPREGFFADGTPIREAANPVHLRLPNDSGNISKSSVSCLYGAVVCCALKDLSILLERRFSQDENQGFAYGIYAFFRLFADDTRHSVSFFDMMKTIADVKKYGYHGAASVNAIPTGYCLKCNKKGKGKKVLMEESDESPSNWKCPQCGTTDVLKVAFSAKHLRNIGYKLLKELTIVSEALPLYFEDIIPMYKHSIQNGPNVKADFLKYFKEYDLEASKDLLNKRERWVITHYDLGQKSKRRQCHIPIHKFKDIEMNDIRYVKGYKPSITMFAKSFPRQLSLSQVIRAIEVAQSKDRILTKFYNAAYDVLIEMGWPKPFIKDKLSHDICYALLTR